MLFNCAKSIGSAFKFGAGYEELAVTSPRRLSLTRLAAAANANLPTEMAMKLISEWSRRGYAIDVVLYKKYGGSTYIDPHEEEKVAFKDLPNRFPSVRSRDFRREEGAYRDFDNLYARYLPYNLGNPGEFTVAELAEIVLRLTGSSSKVEHLPLPKDDPTRRKPDITRAQTDLGWQPTIALEDGLMRTVAWLKTQDW